jgi:hypothetical protein
LWLKVGGKAVFITNAKNLLRNSFDFNPAWKLVSEHTLKVAGLNLSIFEFERIN